MGWAPTPPLDVRRWLNRREQHLFRAQSKADQAHATRVACRLLAQGHSDPLLIRAALLHDVGKAGAGIAVPHRVAWVLAGRLAPRLRAVLARHGRAWAALANHPAIGSARLRQERADPRLVALVAGHPLPGDEERLRLLAEADESV